MTHKRLLSFILPLALSFSPLAAKTRNTSGQTLANKKKTTHSLHHKSEQEGPSMLAWGVGLAASIAIIIGVLGHTRNTPSPPSPAENGSK